MRNQIRQHVRRAPVEELIVLAVAYALDRALELQLEILERRHLRKLVPLLLQEVIRLIHHRVGRESSAQLFDQRCLAGPMAS
jgi:hypothetical protein